MYIHSVTILTEKLQAQRRFYAETLGFPVLRETPGAFTVRAGRTELTLEAADDTSTGSHHIAFNVPPHQFEEAVAWAEERVPLMPHEGALIVDFSKTSWRARSVYFEDAAGNVLEFIGRERTPMLDAPSPFGIDNVLGIGEIGMATADPATLTLPLMEQAGLPVFDGDPAGSFCALGDDHGLLLMVEPGRAWLPTEDRLAEVSVVQVTVGGDMPMMLATGPYMIEVCAGNER